MSTTGPISRDHSLFWSATSEKPCFVRGRAGVGKSIFLSELALCFLQKEKYVLHISTQKHQDVAHQYERYPHQISLEKRLLHSRIGEPLTALEILRIHAKYKTILSFHPDLIIVEGAAHIDSSWNTVHNIGCSIYISTSQEEISIDGQIIDIVEVGSSIEIHSLHSTSRVCIHPEKQRIYEEHRSTNTSVQKIMYASGATGAETKFGEEAEKWGIKEVHFSFPSHIQNRAKGTIILNEEELSRGTVCLMYVSRKLRRTWEQTPQLKNVLQLIWHIVHSCEQLFVVGSIQEDGSVHGGTGWSVELAQRWNKPVWVFDQEQQQWFSWNGQIWIHDTPTISRSHFACSGTRFLQPSGHKAIEDLFERSFSSQ